jgi:hypothetical protein
MSEKKPEVIYFPANRKYCPVCGKVSYSQSGEHPQCAVARADAVFKARQSARLGRRPAAVAPKVVVRKELVRNEVVRK